MIVEPLNDEDCLGQIVALARAAQDREDVQAIAAQLGSLRAVKRLLRRLPRRPDGPYDPTPGPRVQCDVPQRVRLVPLDAPDVNCVEVALAYLVLAEAIDPRPTRTLMTVVLPSDERHTFPVEANKPVWLDLVATTRNQLAAALHRVRNANGDRGQPLEPVEALAWAVGLTKSLVAHGEEFARRHKRATDDVQRIANGLAPAEPAALTWALSAAIPEALPFGPDGIGTLMSAAGLLDQLAGTGKKNESAGADTSATDAHDNGAGDRAPSPSHTSTCARCAASASTSSSTPPAAPAANDPVPVEEHGEPQPIDPYPDATDQPLRGS